MKTPQDTATTLETPKDAIPQGNASKVMETPVETPVETVESLKQQIADMNENLEQLRFLQIGKIKIALQDANRVLHSASCKAGNLSKVALANGIGRVAKDMSGGGTLIPTVSSLSDMKAKGLLGETDSKEGKAIVQLTVEQVKALNMIVDGFTMFGLCKRS